MKTVIKLKVSELNDSFVERLKSLLEGSEDTELTIHFNDENNAYQQTLSGSKTNLEKGHDLVTLTMDELETYSGTRKAGVFPKPVDKLPKKPVKNLRGSLKLTEEEYASYQQHAKNIRNEWDRDR